MRNLRFELPPNIKQLIDGYSIEIGPSGLSGAGLYKLKKENNTLFLKIVNINNRFIGELEVECNALKWLNGKVPVPRVICFEKTENKHYLLMTSVEGETLQELYERDISVEEMIKIYAESLKYIHSIDIQGCPIDSKDDFMLSKVRNNLELGITLENMEDEYKNLSKWQLYDKLISLKPKKSEYVFIHGDYCLDNIIIKNNKINGFIDIGRGGVGDKYRDIALAVRNICGDFGEQWISLFFQVYGINDPDWSKIEFYVILDEFF